MPRKAGHRAAHAWMSPIRDRYVGRTAMIVGKGPSLDKIDQIKDRLSECVVFCINESIHKVEALGLDPSVPLHVVQQDTKLHAACVPKFPTTMHFMNRLIQRTRNMRGHPPGWAPAAIMYHPRDLKVNPTTLTAVIAIRIARTMGIQKFILVGFDSWKAGGSLEYAGCVGYSSSARWPAERFLKQRHLIERELAGFEHEVIFL